MRNSALQERRNRQILADIVRAYIETGEPVSSRVISKGFEETLSTATIRNVMADLEDGGFLYQPHTSAGRVPTAAAYRFFAQEIASQATITAVDREWIQREMGGATSAAEITERAGHVLAEVSNGLGIIVSPPLGKTVLEHARMWLLPDGRVVVVLISPGGNTRDKILRPHRLFAQVELDATAEFLNRHYSGWTLEAMQRLAAKISHRARTLRRHRAERSLAMRSGAAGRRSGAARARRGNVTNRRRCRIPEPGANARFACSDRGEAPARDGAECLH